MLCSLHTDTDSPEQRDERGPFVTTYSGARFFVDDCNIADIPMYDIAHALSQNCRFNGHLERFYSVAEHSVIVSALVPEEYALTALLHDVSEAFVPDMPRPFKRYITGFEEYEERIQRSVAEHYGTIYPLPEEVKYIDKNIVRDEAEFFYPKPPSWITYYESVVHPGMFDGWEPDMARQKFMEHFVALMYERMDNEN